ncbi:ubiquinone biosynthesis protein coq4 [Plasmopara halstedii]|uniref:Ubiquinone biosynthesis protein COQ4 homolog, mitochondrial n=1 Tax=Plasmopara halstedii TaxID=4781 RepID=A0A0P1B7B8_PLAHL|nr:ubiquinone biosynthesis protein coq4 [Plasmopara halstedii]CEG50223.1 ubiquinone biosynthesis protein coq4 [Plasmopara halstedii]|eukprot:XP_024586592.1 ubiquinone biosynthesis protein coq4 [Plasmopara halstedii]
MRCSRLLSTATRSLHVSPIASSSIAESAISSVAGAPQCRVLYDSHVPTTPLQKILLSITSALTVFANPERGDMLAALGEVTGRDALRSIHARMCSNPVGARILAEKPVIRSDKIEMNCLRALSTDSFGYHYATYMDTHDFHADDRSLVRFVDDPELAYVMQRHREVHDFWHTLFGVPPTVLGEIALKYVEMVHSMLPVSALSAFVGPLRLSREERCLLMNIYVPWASQAARSAHSLHCVMYEEEFETPIEELRQRLNIIVAPPFKNQKDNMH